MKAIGPTQHLLCSLCFNDGYLEKGAIMTCLVGRQGLEGLGTWMLEVGVGLNTEGDIGLR